jgi:hypothetical protein
MNAGETSHNLPDFLIVGAQKCGTSALRANLRAHTGITLPEEELHFFDSPRKWELGLDWYRGHFPHTDLLQGEKTPEYLSNRRATERIAQHVPSAKIIIMLRDPVTRAYSHWNHMTQKIDVTAKRGWEVLPFGEAIARAFDGVKPYVRILDKGIYIDQILPYTESFPADRIYIGIQERFLANGAEELAGVFRFLGVEEQPIEPKQGHVRHYDAPMDPEVRRKLLEYYAPFNQRLFEFLGTDIPEWSRP